MIAREDFYELLNQPDIQISVELIDLMHELFRHGNQALSDVLDTPVIEETNSNMSTGGHIINTYPFGSPTDIISNELLAVCGREMSLKRTLSYIVSFCKKMDSHHPQESKTVVLLTDKWDNNVFSKIEARLINYFNQNNFNFVFYLVSDYGMTRIPFLTVEQCTRRPDIVVTEGGRSFAGNLNKSKQNQETIIYTFNPNIGLSVGRLKDKVQIIIDVANKTCTKNGIIVGRVTNSALYHLLRRLDFLNKYPEDILNPRTVAIDSDEKTLIMNNVFVDMIFCPEKSVAAGIETALQIFISDIGG